MYMREEARTVVISQDVRRGGIIQLALKKPTKRSFVMRTARISHGKSLPRRQYYVT